MSDYPAPSLRANAHPRDEMNQELEAAEERHAETQCATETTLTMGAVRPAGLEVPEDLELR